MSFIDVNGISKTFKVKVRNSGLKSAMKSFFNSEYKSIQAVKNVSFSIKKGEIVGYLGPNGAGKSTTIKMLSGILKPDSGSCKIDGMNPFEDRIKYVSKIGVVFGQKSQLWWDIPVIDSFDLLKSIYKISDEEYEKNLNELIELLKIKEIIKTPVRQLSLGQRMRCEIAASLLHNPKILFLDEPTIGLDAVSKVAVRKFISDINKKKKVTVILTTHDMADIEALAKRVIVIGKGEKLYDGNLKDIKNKLMDKKNVEIIFSNIEKIPDIKYTKIIEESKTRVLLSVDINNISVSDVINKYSKLTEIKDINVYEENIDNIIIKLYKGFDV